MKYNTLEENVGAKMRSKVKTYATVAQLGMNGSGSDITDSLSKYLYHFTWLFHIKNTLQM